MTTTPQAALLSDDEIERHFEINKSAPGRELRRLIGRSIEADVLAKLQATLPQVGQPSYLFAEFDGEPDHILKTDPDAFDAVAAGLKTHEIRKDDRGFKVGDKLLLKRTRYTGRQMHMSEDPYPLEYTGEEVRRVVSHIQLGYGLGAGWVILSFAATQAEPAQVGDLPDEQLKNGSAKELQALFKSTKVDTHKSRISKRLAIKDAQIHVLSACLDEIKRKARETPAWACAYNSAITSIELKLSAIKSNY